MNIYKFADGSRVTGIDAQAAGERLAELQSQHPVLTPSLIVEEARPEDSILHPVFEWDDTIAAEAHREWQARNLLKSIRIVKIDGIETEPRRAFVNVITADASRGYISTAIVFKDEVLREQVLVQAKADLKAWRIRYRELEELSELFAAIDPIISEAASLDPESLVAKPV